MANNYLNSVLDVLSAVQARQISELLQGLQAAGTVRDREEYSSTLSELSSLINNVNPVPSFVPIYGKIWELCSSDAHNLMMTSIKNDLEALFIQLNEIGEKLEDHHLLFIKNILSDLERGLNNQENTIKRLKLLADKNNEFTDVLVNTFSSSSGFRITKSDPEGKFLFFDNRTYRILSKSEIPSAVISDAQSLIIDNKSNIEPRINPVAVKLQTDNYSYNTERHVDEATDISNIIDNKQNTFWSYNVYLMDSVPEVHIILDFTLGAAKDVNYIVIEPANSKPFSVSNIDGISVNGDRVNLVYEEVTINGKTRIDFDRANLVSVLVTLSTKTFDRADYYVRVNPSVNEDSDQIEKANALSVATTNVLGNSDIVNICNVPDRHFSQVNHNVYSFSLDNIWFGNSLYSDTGIFLSAPLEIIDPGLAAIKVEEKAETGIIQNSIEYDLIKINTYPKYTETKIAVPYLNQTTVTSERIVLTKKTATSILNNVGKTRFLPDLSSSVSLYRNGILQTLGRDWFFAIQDILRDSSQPSFVWQSSLLNVDYYNYNIWPLGYYINIPNIDIRSIYTIDYTIFNSDIQTSSGEYKTIWLDKDKTISLQEKGHIQFERNLEYYTESKLYLQITLRRNKPSRAETPELYEYAILANKYNDE